MSSYVENEIKFNNIKKDCKEMKKGWDNRGNDLKLT
jgi:hypothetical protein